ncbi:hypothetical protein MNBD_CHLOROFLEXI01-4817 [hydrothermal vent metagenome]|uniref:Extracellular nuclease n=1 Tax=hydrothermal vent metagenome TaxID=652676 RepID=A0A3B0VFZ8_9ZZZZ
MTKFPRLALLIILIVGGFGSSIQKAHGGGVVGSGTAVSCTESALNTALTGGGLVSFNCGAAPHTINITSEKLITTNSSIDGDSLITLDGGGGSRIFRVQTNVSFTVRQMNINNGFTPQEGGGIYAEEAVTLTVEESSFTGNVSTQLAQNYDGGGAISVERRSTAVISDSSFTNNSAGNGGAIAIGGWDTNDDGGTISITDSIFTNNTATEDGSILGGGDGGGAVYLRGGSYGTVSGSTFTGNQAANGGAVHMLNAGVSITDSSFNNNIASHNFGLGGGGAVYMDGGDDGFTNGITIHNSQFNGNSSNLAGGAIFSFPEGAETTTITDSTFDGNFSYSRGQAGAIYHQSADGDGTMSIDGSTFINNYAINSTPPDGASQGGAIWLINGPTTISNSTFYGNDASNLTLPADDWRRGFGGALVAHTPVTIINSTFANNTAGFVGGAIAPANANLITIRNSIIANNSGANPWGIQQNCTNGLIDGGNNLEFAVWTSGCSVGITADPLLGTLGDYGGNTQTVPLLDGSLAINAGNAATCTPTDQRGFARNGVCDMGAFEFGGGLLINSISPPWRGLNESGDMLLTVQGAGFSADSVIRWNGADRTTTYVNGLLVTAVIPAADLTSLGSYSVTVYDTARMLESDAVTFSVVPFLNKLYLPLVER